MILPGAALGLLGGGQLGRMFTARARTMGYEVVVLDPDPHSPAGGIANRHLQAPYDEPSALEELAASVAAVTTEFENVPAAALEFLAARVRVTPDPGAVAIAQDRIREKAFLQEAGIPTAPFQAVPDADGLEAAWETIGAPALLKTSRLGYDGKGQAAVGTREEARRAFASFGGVPCVLERKLTLEAELSVVLARGDDGTVATYPPGENIHAHGILYTTTVPSHLTRELTHQAVSIAALVAERLEYVGVLGVELFVADGGRLYANEMAPRPHNSGHFSQDACDVCQFEQQVRALCGLPLLTPRLLTPVCMINLLGDLWQTGEPKWAAALALPGVKLHLYGKREARPGRKMGHLNCMSATAAGAHELARQAFERLSC
ncbi:MAG TPA: 5-(carboxyamino)imidazole ribonucleotide synthase [Gemmatimonadales bacterium]|nr:5-(carboxyamino)imidazole ribonucleotide synthase [Gemmatimonadales bacterium]